MFLSSAFTDLYVPRRLRSARPSTMRRWRVTLRTFDKFLKRRATVADLTDDTLAAFACWRAAAVSPATCNTDLKTLLALARHLARRGVLSSWPECPLCPEPQRTPRAWTRDDFQRLLGAAGRASGMIGDCPASVWWQALLLTIFDTGERIGAVCVYAGATSSSPTAGLCSPPSPARAGDLIRLAASTSRPRICCSQCRNPRNSCSPGPARSFLYGAPTRKSCDLLGSPPIARQNSTA